MENPFDIILEKLKKIDSDNQRIISNQEEILIRIEAKIETKYYSIEETASILKVGKETVRNYIAKGSLKGSKIGVGRRFFIKHTDLFDVFGNPTVRKYKRQEQSHHTPEIFIKDARPYLNKINYKVRLSKNRKNKDGKMPLGIAITYQGKTIKKQFPIRLRAEQFKDGVILSADDEITFKRYNHILTRYVRFYEDLKYKILEGQYVITPEYIKREIQKV